jgi:hypothetical protein
MNIKLRDELIALAENAGYNRQEVALELDRMEIIHGNYPNKPRVQAVIRYRYLDYSVCPSCGKPFQQTGKTPSGVPLGRCDNNHHLIVENNRVYDNFCRTGYAKYSGVPREGYVSVSVPCTVYR